MRFAHSLPRSVSAALAALLLSGCGKDTSTAPDFGDASIPAVQGLRAAVDTSAGTVRLSWSPNAHPGRAAYLVYRLGGSPGVAVLAGHTEDTVFLDSARSRLRSDDLELRYQVRILDKAERVGLGSAAVAVHLPPASRIRTRLTLASKGDDQGLVDFGDTVTLSLDFVNPGRPVREIRWTVEGKPGLDRTTRPSARDGKETLTFTADKMGQVIFRIVAVDEGGGESRVAVDFQVARIRSLAPRQGDPNWSNSGPFTSHVAGDNIVYQDPGFTPRIYNRTGNRWTEGAPLPGSGQSFGTLAVGTAYYAHGPGWFVYDFRRDQWSVMRSPPVLYGKPAALDGKLYYLPPVQKPGDTLTLWRYEPEADQWSAVLSVPPNLPGSSPEGVEFTLSNLVPYRGKLYAIRNAWAGENRTLIKAPGMAVLNPDSGTCVFTGGLMTATASWNYSVHDTPAIARALTGGSWLRIFNYLGEIHTYDPAAGAWIREWDFSPHIRTKGYIRESADGEDALFLFNRPTNSLDQQELIALDLATGAKSRLVGGNPQLGWGAELTVVGKTLLIYGRSGVFLSYDLP